MATRLSSEDIEARLRERPRWRLVDGKLFRKLKFQDFVEAFGFMTRVALRAEAMNHHPEWSNVWNTVRISLATHDVAGISELDFSLAEQIDACCAGS